jgi:sulfur-oxidizing protein SoxZ
MPPILTRRLSFAFAAPLLFALLLTAVGADAPAAAQDAEAGVVKLVVTTHGGVRRVGSGFVVRIDEDRAYILTAAHVVDGAKETGVVFRPRRLAAPLPATVVGPEHWDKRGLALIVVPAADAGSAGAHPLPLSEERPPGTGTELRLIGHPRTVGDWSSLYGRVAAREGKALKVQVAVDEGSSGGPALWQGQVVGAVVEELAGIAVVSPVVSIRTYLEGYGVTAAAESDPAAAPTEQERPTASSSRQATESSVSTAAGGSALPSPEEVAAAFSQVRTAFNRGSSEAITLKAPDIAENGAVVPVTFESDARFDLAWLISGDGCISTQMLSRSPAVLGYHSTRIKMGKTGNIVALARGDGGRPQGVEKEVKIVVGGFGGDIKSICDWDAERFYRERINAVESLARVPKANDSGTNIKIRAKRSGDEVELKALITHPMETGVRIDHETGKTVPAHYIEAVGIYLNDEPMAYLLWGPVIAKNPYLAVRWQGMGEPGDQVRIRLIDNRGESASGVAQIK